MRKAASPLFFVIIAAIMLASPVASAQDVPRDFISGSGWFLKQSPSTAPDGRGTFGVTGGVRSGDWFGDLVYEDQALGLEVKSLTVTGYLRVGTDSTDAIGKPVGTRDICGAARTNRFGDVFYRVSATDNGKPDSRDTFMIGLATASGTVLYFAQGSLGNPTPGNGNVQLHGGNKKSIPPSTPPDCSVPQGGGELPPTDTTPPTVAITSPTSGATVSGTVAVRASASDNVAVAGVQFFVDGSPIGAEDTTAPYEVAWDTSSVGDGSHTLTARARDTAGNTATSATSTVTVSNAAPAPTRFEERAATLAPAGAWSDIRSAGIGVMLSGDRAVFASAAGATATFPFSGTGVSWLGVRCEICGIARAMLDGVEVASVDTFAPPPRSAAVMFSSSGLAPGSHTLVIEVTGTANPSSGGAFIVVDAFDVTP